MKQIVFTPAGQRQWLRLSADIRRRIDVRLNNFAATGQGDVKRLKGREGARLRIGDWRVIFFEDQNRIIIAAVGHRRDVYD
jgi:mRNA interferase RelE/StbE